MPSTECKCQHDTRDIISLLTMDVVRVHRVYSEALLAFGGPLNTQTTDTQFFGFSQSLDENTDSPDVRTGRSDSHSDSRCSSSAHLHLVLNPISFISAVDLEFQEEIPRHHRTLPSGAVQGHTKFGGQSVTRTLFIGVS